jgi:Na+/proline symporter
LDSSYFTLVAVVVYGVFIGRGQKSNESYLKADNKMPWYIVLIGIMATQASAITFLSAPGQLIQTECVSFSITFSCLWR